MKVHTDLKELLEDLLEDLEINGFLMKEMPIPDVVDLYLSSNSLALGKPEPLAKNKHSGNKCDNKADKLDYIGQYCDCGLFECKKEEI